jgi:hypothetical protein
MIVASMGEAKAYSIGFDDPTWLTNCGGRKRSPDI